MKTIERYVFFSFMSSFALAFMVLSFVLTIGLLVKIVGFILDGVSAELIIEFAKVSLPETLQWTIPLALLVSSVLVFSRLSADSEIAAMRACGIHLFTIMKWPLLFALCTTLLAVWINNEVVPRGHEVRRSLTSKVSVDTGLEVLKPGEWIEDFAKVKIYFAGKQGNWLTDLFVLDTSNPNITNRTLRARSALVTAKGRDIHLDLRNVEIDPIDENHPGVFTSSFLTHVVKDALKSSEYKKRDKDLRFSELTEQIEKNAAMRDELAAKEGAKAVLQYLERTISGTKVEISKRFVYAFAALCFVMIGIPLGIKSQRKESTVGMGVSLIVALGFYLIVMSILSFADSPAIHPEIVIWTPVAVCVALGVYLTRKHL